MDRLPFKAMRPNVAPATASDKPRSTNTTRATNSYRTTSSSNIALATKTVVPFLRVPFLFFLVDSSFSCSFFYLTVPLLFLFFLHWSFLYLTVPSVFLLLLDCSFIVPVFPSLLLSLFDSSFRVPFFTWLLIYASFLCLIVPLPLLDCASTVFPEVHTSEDFQLYKLPVRIRNHMHCVVL